MLPGSLGNMFHWARGKQWDTMGPDPYVLQSFPTACSVPQPCQAPCNPMDYSPPGSSIHGIFEARVPEWGAIAFSLEVLDSPNTASSHCSTLQWDLTFRLSSRKVRQQFSRLLPYHVQFRLESSSAHFSLVHSSSISTD